MEIVPYDAEQNLDCPDAKEFEAALALIMEGLNEYHKSLVSPVVAEGEDEEVARARRSTIIEEITTAAHEKLAFFETGRKDLIKALAPVISQIAGEATIQRLTAESQSTRGQQMGIWQSIENSGLNSFLMPLDGVSFRSGSSLRLDPVLTMTVWPKTFGERTVVSKEDTLQTRAWVDGFEPLDIRVSERA